MCRYLTAAASFVARTPLAEIGKTHQFVVSGCQPPPPLTFAVCVHRMSCKYLFEVACASVQSRITYQHTALA